MYGLKPIFLIISCCILFELALTINIVPGHGCGIMTKINRIKKITQQEMGKDWGCTIVEDEESYKKYMKKTTISFQDYIKQNRWDHCQVRNNCSVGETCAVHDDCQGQDNLTCHNRECVPCQTVDKCVFGQGCTADHHCMQRKTLRCSNHSCDICGSIDNCETGEECKDHSDCKGEPSLICSTKSTCAACATENLCNVGSPCSIDSECGGAADLACSSDDACAACASVQRCSLGQTCTTFNDCLRNQSLRCSGSQCHACEDENSCVMGEKCQNDLDCRSQASLICSSTSSTCTTCETENRCYMGDSCSNDMECGGEANLACSSSTCTACAGVQRCSLNQSCSATIECLSGQSLRCSNSLCRPCSEIDACEIGEVCANNADCQSTPSLICSNVTSTCVACETENLCGLGHSCSADSDCGGAENLECSSNECSVIIPEYLHSTKLLALGSISPRKSAALVDLSGNQGICPNVPDSENEVSPFVMQRGSLTLVCGGSSIHPSPQPKKCFQYEDNKLTFSNILTKHYRVYASSIKLDKDRWLIAGGSNSKRKVTVFDFRNNTFTDGPDLPDPRNKGFNMVRYNETHIMLIGKEVADNTTLFYTIETKEWTNGPSSMVPRRYPQAGFIKFKNGTKVIALVGGIDEASGEYLDVEDPSMTWRFGPDLTRTVSRGCVVQVENTFYIVGNGHSGAKNDIYKFNIDAEEWQVLTEKLPNEVVSGTCAFVPDDNVNCPP